jgi:hypothetical protein
MAPTKKLEVAKTLFFDLMIKRGLVFQVLFLFKQYGPLVIIFAFLSCYATNKLCFGSLKLSGNL